MVTMTTTADGELAKRLRKFTETDPDYWSFRRNAVREHSHGMFQYPAMMVPQMQSRLIGEIMAVDGRVHCIYDPFVGAGTVLTEAMLRGLSFQGCDLNPLAVLVSRVKTGPFFVAALRARWEGVKARSQGDRRKEVECKYAGWHKWFTIDVAIKLTRLVRAIRSEDALWCRRFFWVALAETVRLASNSRTSTFKLHVRPADEIISRAIDPVGLFGTIVERNLNRLRENSSLLEATGRIRRGRYEEQVHVAWGDTASESQRNGQPKADLLVTSPPYGDNATTVPYGQHAFLPLQWIDLDDIEEDISPEFLANTHAIDSRSLGGLKSGALEDVETVCQRSKSLARLLGKLRNEPRDRAVRVAAFWRDLDKCLLTVFHRLRKNAYMVWVVGERRVANSAIPMQSILAELIESRGGVPVALLERRIPSKRMAVRNDISETMVRERVLIMRKGA